MDYSPVITTSLCVLQLALAVDDLGGGFRGDELDQGDEGRRSDGGGALNETV